MYKTGKKQCCNKNVDDKIPIIDKIFLGNRFDSSEMPRKIIEKIVQGSNNNEISLCIIGKGFCEVVNINFDNIIIKNFSIISDNEIKVNIPNINKKDILVSVSTCNKTSNQVFLNIFDPPIISRIDPIVGPVDMTINIKIYGVNFTTLKYISFGNIIIDALDKNVTVQSDSLISFYVLINTSNSIPLFIVTEAGISNTVFYNGVPRPMI
jgi:hypothetical protein